MRDREQRAPAPKSRTAPAPAVPPHLARMHALQRSAGNRAVSNMVLARRVPQAEQEGGEQEAEEQVAEEILEEIPAAAKHAELRLFAELAISEEAEIEAMMRPRIEDVSKSTGRKGKLAKVWGAVKGVAGYATQKVADFFGHAKDVVDVVPGINIATNSVTGALDARSMVKTAGHYRDLDKLHGQLKDSKSALADDVAYARRQKGQKGIKKALGVVGAGLGIAAGALALASNPVGWSLAIAGLALGGGIIAYKIWRKIKGKRGAVRKATADKIMTALTGGLGEAEVPHARAAVTALGLDPDVLLQDEDKARAMLFRKLASA